MTKTTYTKIPNTTAGAARQWNTPLPTQTVVGWTTPEKVTDEQIDELLRQIAPHLFNGGLTGYVLSPTIPNYRKAVREWMENL